MDRFAEPPIQYVPMSENQLDTDAVTLESGGWRVPSSSSLASHETGDSEGSDP